MRLAAIDAALPLCLIAAALLVFPGLGATRLWQDEAQTAAVAKNVLRSGLPLASDGDNTVTIFADGRDLRDGVYIWQPWLPNYLAAASMFVFGTDSFGARFPFAFAFVLLVLVCHRFFTRWQDDPLATGVALALMLGSVAMLLHARECRYYAVAALLSVLVTDAHLRLRAGEGKSAILRLALFATLLFNSFPPGAALLAVALGIDWLRSRPSAPVARNLAIAAAIITLANLPVAVYLRIWDRQFGVQPGYSDLRVFGLYLLRYLLSLNLFFFPALLALLAGALRWRSLARGRLLADDLTALLLAICTVQLLGFSLLSDYPFTRYLIAMAPFCFFLGARCVVAVAHGRSAAAWLLVAVILGSNLLALPALLPLRPTALGRAPWSSAGIDPAFLVPGDIGGSIARGEIGRLIRTPRASPLLEYLGALVRPAPGPMDALIAHLEAVAEPSDHITIAYGDLPLIFHTDLKVQRPGDEATPGDSPPRFFVPRHFHPVPPSQLGALGIARSRYQELELGVPDYQWNNRPDPLYHRFAPSGSPEAPPLRLFVLEAPLP
jgi:4-amino-4-deoxy-L-arabinose transferase-like glycosyltransferase